MEIGDFIQHRTGSTGFLLKNLDGHLIVWVPARGEDVVWVEKNSAIASREPVDDELASFVAYRLTH